MPVAPNYANDDNLEELFTEQVKIIRFLNNVIIKD